MKLLSTKESFLGIFPSGKSILSLHNHTDEKGARKSRKQGRKSGAEVKDKEYWNKWGAILKNKTDATRYTQDIKQVHGTLHVTITLFVDL